MLLLSLDSHISRKLNKISEFHVIKEFFKGISRLGDGIFWYALMIFILIFDELPRSMPIIIHMAVGGLTGTILYKFLKKTINRPRPYQINSQIKNQGKAIDQFSFPSGHTLHAVIFSIIVISYYPILLLPLTIFTLLVGFSRIILGLHYPSDVIFAVLLGFLISRIYDAFNFFGFVQF
ncbi:MAG: phosphatase PAP2 family protein [Methylophilaceae bacterium]